MPPTGPQSAPASSIPSLPQCSEVVISAYQLPVPIKPGQTVEEVVHRLQKNGPTGYAEYAGQQCVMDGVVHDVIVTSADVRKSLMEEIKKLEGYYDQLSNEIKGAKLALFKTRLAIDKAKDMNVETLLNEMAQWKTSIFASTFFGAMISFGLITTVVDDFMQYLAVRKGVENASYLAAEEFGELVRLYVEGDCTGKLIDPDTKINLSKAGALLQEVQRALRFITNPKILGTVGLAGVAAYGMASVSNGNNPAAKELLQQLAKEGHGKAGVTPAASNRSKDLEKMPFAELDTYHRELSAKIAGLQTLLQGEENHEGLAVQVHRANLELIILTAAKFKEYDKTVLHELLKGQKKEELEDVIAALQLQGDPDQADQLMGKVLMFFGLHGATALLGVGVGFTVGIGFVHRRAKWSIFHNRMQKTKGLVQQLATERAATKLSRLQAMGQIKCLKAPKSVSEATSAEVAAIAAPAAVAELHESTVLRANSPHPPLKVRGGDRGRVRGGVRGSDPVFDPAAIPNAALVDGHWMSDAKLAGRSMVSAPIFGQSKVPVSVLSPAMNEVLQVKHYWGAQGFAEWEKFEQLFPEIRARLMTAYAHTPEQVANMSGAFARVYEVYTRAPVKSMPLMNAVRWGMGELVQAWEMGATPSVDLLVEAIGPKGFKLINLERQEAAEAVKAARAAARRAAAGPVYSQWPVNSYGGESAYGYEPMPIIILPLPALGGAAILEMLFGGAAAESAAASGAIHGGRLILQGAGAL